MGFIKNFFLRRIVKSQLKNVPVDEQERITKLVEKNPELFQTLALEMQEKMKQGKDQMTAAMEVMQAHEEELKKVL